MYTSKVITTKLIIKNKQRFIGFLLHQIPNYLNKEHFEFNHLGYTYINKNELKKPTLLHLSKK